MSSNAWAGCCQHFFPTMAAKLAESDEPVAWRDVFAARWRKQKQWDAKKGPTKAEKEARIEEKEAKKAAKQLEKGYRGQQSKFVKSR